MLQRKEITSALSALLILSTLVCRGENELSKRSDAALKSYLAASERLDSAVSRCIEMEGSGASEAAIKASLKDSAERSIEKVMHVIQAINQRALRVGDPISTFKAFFGPDFPPVNETITRDKSNWIKIDLFPNKLFKDSRHIPLGWMLWIEIGNDERVISYFLTDQRKLTARQLGP